MCTTTAYSRYIHLSSPFPLFLLINPILPLLPQPIILFPERQKRRQIEVFREHHVIVQLFEPTSPMRLCDLLKPLQGDDEHGWGRRDEVTFVYWSRYTGLGTRGSIFVLKGAGCGWGWVAVCGEGDILELVDKTPSLTSR